MKKLLLPLLFISVLYADKIEFMKIQKVRSWDVLNLRLNADSDSKKLIGISYKETCLINYGCGKDIDLEAMLDMEEVQVKAFLLQAQEDWCYVEYKGIKGWASKYYLSESTSDCTK